MLQLLDPTTRTDGAVLAGVGGVVAWVLLTILGTQITYFLPLVVLSITDADGWLLVCFCYGAGAGSGAMAGLLVGGGQRLLLPAWLPWTKDWVRGTTLGWALGGALCWAGSGLIYTTRWPVNSALTAAVTLLIGLVSGAGLGGGQWLILFARSTSLRWIIGTALAWGFGFAAAWLGVQVFSPTVTSHDYIGFLLLLLTIVGGLAGLGTSVVLQLHSAQVAPK